MTRVCNKCLMEKVISEFHREKEGKDGFRAVCKICRREESKQWALNNRERLNTRARAYNFKNRLRNRLYRYKLTPEQYYQMLKDQNGLCKICITKTNDQQLVVNHNHKTGKTRELLCRKCNTLLSGLEADGWLNKALEYLKRHQD